MTWVKELLSKLSMVSEFWAFMKARRNWWLVPIITLLLMLGILIAVTQGSALAPFIYTLF